MGMSCALLAQLASAVCVEEQPCALVSVLDLVVQSPFGRLLVAAVLGGLLGWERERHGRPAGFRTHILLCVGSCLIMLVSEHMYLKYKADENMSLRVDPGRIAAQIVTGIGFLGAGAIMRLRTTIRGLTTAACLWLAAAIGMAVGCGFIGPAVMATGVGLISLLALAQFEKHMTRDKYRTLKVWVVGADTQLDTIMGTLRQRSAEVLGYKFEKHLKDRTAMYDINLVFRGEDTRPAITADLAAIEEVHRVAWE
jgi:putative Mg2+ transporter-C (MgtC) family protein